MTGTEEEAASRTGFTGLLCEGLDTAEEVTVPGVLQTSGEVAGELP